MLVPDNVIIIIYYFMEFTIKHWKVTETFGVITVDLFVAVYARRNIFWLTFYIISAYDFSLLTTFTKWIAHYYTNLHIFKPLL